MNITRYHIRYTILHIAVLLFAFTALSSCASRVSTLSDWHERIESRDTTRTKQELNKEISQKRDSTYSRDSIWVFLKGDTVHHYHNHSEYHEIEHRDTIVMLSRDTLYINKESSEQHIKDEKTETTKTRIPGWAWAFMAIGMVASIGTASGIAIYLSKKSKG